jgi:hypothetical protein
MEETFHSTYFSFEYLGDYTPLCEDAPPLCQQPGLLFSGWATKNNPDAGAEAPAWSVQVNDISAELLCELPELNFLEICHQDGLRCWVTGSLMFTRPPSFMPVVYSVYGTHGPVEQVSRSVASQLARSALESCLRRFFFPSGGSQLLLGRGGIGPSTFHPVAYSSLMEENMDLQGTPEALRALLFVAHSEANARTRTCVYYGQDSMRLGASGFTFRASQGRQGQVFKHEAPRLLPGQVVRGCALIAPEAETLLCVLTSLLRSDRGRGTRKTLIVADKASAPFILESLTKNGLFVMGLLSVPDFHSVLFELSPIVLVSIEMLLHRSLEPHLVAMQGKAWGRCVTIGWPMVAQELSITRVSFKYETHLALATSEELLTHRHLIDALAVAALLGLHESSLQDPFSLQSLLHQQVLHLAPCEASLGSRHPELRYTVLRAPDLEPREEAGLAGHSGSKRVMKSMLGSICDAGRGSFPLLAEGTTALQHFTNLAVPLSSFAMAQLREERDDDECPVCFESRPPVLTSCGHRYCESCLQLSLVTQRKCPACRTPLGSNAIVQTRPPPEEMNSYLQHVLDLLKQRSSGGRALVLASWGEHHERLAAFLRRKGLQACWAWRGSSRQLCVILRRFTTAPRGVLIVDPCSDCFPLSWARFSDVSDMYVLWPLQEDDWKGQSFNVCCQLRRARATAPSARVMLVTRESGSVLPVAPRCSRAQVRGLECPLCLCEDLLAAS